MTVLYPNPFYNNEVCYKGAALYMINSIIKVLTVLLYFLT